MTNDLMQFGGGAPAPFPTPAATLATSTMSAANPHSELTLTSFRPASDLPAVAECKEVFDAVLRSREGAAFLYGYDAEQLFQRRAMVVAARRGKQVVGTLQYHPSGGALLVRGMAVNGGQSGQKLGTAMIALALVHGRAVFGVLPAIECIVRELPDGSVNMASAKSFARVGFRLGAASERAYLQATFEDRHMFANAEEDELHGTVFVRYRKMVAGAASYDLARDWLAAWTHAILPVAAPMPRR